MVNVNKLKGLLREKGLTQADVAKCLSVAEPTANQKINNVRPITLDEAEKLSDLLELDAGDFGKYFFAS
jgi:transcriptional regulator with XRE-family HTH domain